MMKMKKYSFSLVAIFCTTCLTSCMRNINTLQQLHALQGETYVYAAIVAFVIFFIALLISKMIPWQGGNDKSYVKRRIALIVCVVFGALGFWVYNQTYVMSHITKTAFQNQFSSTNMKCLLITIVGSILISLIVMVCFRRSKFASIIFKIKGK